MSSGYFRLPCVRLVAMVCIVNSMCFTAAQAAAVSGSVDVVNDYLFRGLTQTNRDPALQAGIEVDGKQGLYAGVWDSNISWLSDGSTTAAPISSSLEVDAYAGWRTTFASGVSIDGGVYTDWNIGVSHSFGHGYAVGLGYYDTNADRGTYSNVYGHYVGRATGILTLTKSF